MTTIDEHRLQALSDALAPENYLAWLRSKPQDMLLGRPDTDHTYLDGWLRTITGVVVGLDDYTQEAIALFEGDSPVNEWMEDLHVRLLDCYGDTGVRVFEVAGHVAAILEPPGAMHGSC